MHRPAIANKYRAPMRNNLHSARAVTAVYPNAHGRACLTRAPKWLRLHKTGVSDYINAWHLRVLTRVMLI